MKQRCAWVNDDPIYINYHDNEWGKPIYDERLLFEFLNLEGMQAGLSWLTILKKRDNYRQAFDNFNAKKIARYSQAKVEALLNNPGIIRNKLKIQAIITNAQAFMQFKEGQCQKQQNSFADYLWSFVEGRPLQNHQKDSKPALAATIVANQLSKDLKKRGFKFVGSTICYAFMQAVGMVNDHAANCFCYSNLANKL